MRRQGKLSLFLYYSLTQHVSLSSLLHAGPQIFSSLSQPCRANVQQPVATHQQRAAQGAVDMEGADSEGDGTPIFDDGDGCAAAPAAAATSQSPRRRTRSLSPTLAAGRPLLKGPSVVWKMMPQCTLEGKKRRRMRRTRRRKGP